MPNHEVIAADEELGRGVYSSRSAKRAQRAGGYPRIFIDNSSPARISVDRLCAAARGVLERIADARAQNRSGQQFYGWAVVLAEDAVEGGRCVMASPNCENPYHADIVLPLPETFDREELEAHAQQLADSAFWCERQT